VFAPTLTGLGERVHLARPDVDLNTHIKDIVNLLVYEDLEDAVLVGWSYGGMVVTGVLDSVPERLAHVAYLDGDVPRDGESDFDVCGPEFRDEMERSAQLFGGGWKASLGDAEAIEAFFKAWLPDIEMTRWLAAKLASSGQPIETFRQPIRLANPAADLVARTFIRCPVDGAAWADIYDPIAARLRKDPHWRVVELASNHLAPLVAPEAVAAALLAISHQLPIAARRVPRSVSLRVDSMLQRDTDAARGRREAQPDKRQSHE
jgi:pimeloyl-ACP methyl ester carboxylesterase